jgi:aryl sulfotransferase
MFGPIMPSVHQWLEFYLSDRYFVGSWASHLSKCWNLRKRSNILVLFFKDMKNDLRGVAARMANFMEVDMTPDELQAVCEKCTFQYMQSIDHKFYAGMVTPWSSRQGKMLRKGGQKDSSELLSPSQQARIDTHFKDALKSLSSDFPYDDVFETER